MDNQMVANVGKIVVGDQIMLLEKRVSGDDQMVLARVLEIRFILGKETYVIETESGKRKVVGASQVSQVTA